MRRTVGILLAAVQFWTTAGVFPAAVARLAANGDFPCAGHSCGCISAEQCFTACCCYTPAQRRKWAQSHEVSAELTERIGPDPAPRACCSHKPAISSSADATASQSGGAAPVIRSMRCRGGGVWIAGACLISPTAAVDSAIEFDDSSEPLARGAARRAVGRSLEPEDPPPRSALVTPC